MRFLRTVVSALLGLALLIPLAAQQPSTARQSLDRLLATELDPQQCFRVRDLFLEREDVKFYFTDGLLIFAKPFDGREVAALYLAAEQGDAGELLVIPPTPRERQSVALFTKEAVLDEQFRSALMLFTDDTADALRTEIERNPANNQIDAGAGAAVAPRWSPVLKNILGGISLRMLADLLSGRPIEEGVFAAAVNGGRLGRFDVVIDPHLNEQVSIGQTVRRDGRGYYNVWAQFEGRSFRQGRRKVDINGSLENYRIEAELAGPNLGLRAVVDADLIPAVHAGRTFAFELSQSLRLESLLVDGEAADFLQLEQSAAGQASRRQNDVVLLTLPSPPSPKTTLRLRFEYSGEVVSRAGNSVFLVTNRGDWYPRGEPTFTDYAMTFRHPAKYDLVATGELVDESVDNGVREVSFRSPAPLRMAGFNVGDYVSASRQVDGYTVEIRANRHVEERLEPRTPLPVVVPTPMLSGRTRRAGGASSIVTPAEAPTPNPAARIEEIADADAATFAYFLQLFGPPPTPRVVVSPIPGGFGQGFPGLVYSATLSYFAADDAPLKKLPPADRQFYAELLRAHEISHQWWGNNVTVLSLADNWLMEGLATYASALNLERRQGPESLRVLLDEFRGRLLQKNDEGRTVESAGPVTLGERLRMERFPGAYRVITYEKSAWALHMLRARLGDEAFFGLLKKLNRDYRLKVITTEAFRKEAAALIPENSPDPELLDFFDQWIYGTGVPRLKVRFSQKSDLLSGTLLMEDVDEAFVTPVELEAVLADGARQRLTVWTDGPETEFQMRLPAKAQKVTIDPDGELLAIKE